MEKKGKKGFWASLFSSKPCKCSGATAYAIPAGEMKNVTDEAAAGDLHSIKEIKVLGPGCAKCKSTFSVVEKVIKGSGMEVRLTKVEDMEEIMRYNILSTPAVVVDGKVMLKGKVPNEAEVRRMLGLS